MIALTTPIGYEQGTDLVRRHFIGNGRDLHQIALDGQTDFDARRLGCDEPVERRRGEHLSHLMQRRQTFIEQADNLCGVITVDDGGLGRTRAGLGAGCRGPESGSRLSGFGQLAPLLLRHGEELTYHVKSQMFGIKVTARHRDRHAAIVGAHSGPSRQQRHHYIPIAGLGLAFHAVFRTIQIEPNMALGRTQLSKFTRDVIGGKHVYIHQLRQ